MPKIEALTGAQAVAEAMRQINPEVVVAYPITPQTPIVEYYSQYQADGLVTSKMITVESEHSAMSACVGASAMGIRAMSATSSQGLALMWEVVAAAAGLRLPIIMPVVNRALSAPINIHCDHSDSMGARDIGWIQIFSESAQEAYENTLIALKLAEREDVMLPAMVMQDGFITSHGVENVTIYDDDKVKAFVGEYKPKNSLFDFENSPTFGALQLTDYYFETKRQQEEAMTNALNAYLEVCSDFSKKVSGKKHGYFETYQFDDADAVIVTLNSSAGTTKAVIDRLRKEGKRVGLLKPYLFRPFPYQAIRDALKDKKVIGVLDRSLSFGAESPLISEVKLSLFNEERKPKIQSYIYGLGGRDLLEEEIETVYSELLKGDVNNEKKYLGLRSK